MLRGNCKIDKYESNISMVDFLYDRGILTNISSKI